MILNPQTSQQGGSGLPNDIAAAAHAYRTSGIAVCRILPGAKTPGYSAWPTRSLEPADFSSSDNIAILPGWLSHLGQPGYCLVVIDLDSANALAMADLHLPPTGMIDGRPSKPRSHRYYLIPASSIPSWAWSAARQAAGAATAAGSHVGPFTRRFKNASGMQIELLGTGSQVAAPPSLHPRGEIRYWDGGYRGNPAVVDFMTLWGAVTELAKQLGCFDSKRTPRRGSRRKTTSAGTYQADSVEQQQMFADAAKRESVYVAGRWWSHRERLTLAVKHFRMGLRQGKLPRSGHGGHNTLFAIVRSFTNDFLVRDPVAVRKAVFQKLNAALAAMAKRTGDAVTFEQWSKQDFEHKLDEALSSVGGEYEPGCGLARHAKSIRHPHKDWHAGDRLAAGYASRSMVWVVDDRWYRFGNCGYVATSKDEVRAGLRRHAEQIHIKVTRKNTGKRPPAVTSAMVTNAHDSLAGSHRLPADTPLNTWLPDGKPRRYLAVANGILDLDSVRLTANGDLDVDAVRLRPHTPDWFATSRLPEAFDRSAPMPSRLQQYLDRVCDSDTAVAQVLQEIAGACLDARLRIKFFACLVGDGNNGKSVYLVILRALLGEQNIASVTLDQLTSNRFAAYGLNGKLANLVGDQGTLALADEAALKRLTGGDAVTFEAKGVNAFSAPNTAKIVVACNTMPRFADRSNAIWSRLVAVPFLAIIHPEERNPDMLQTEYWARDLPGVLNWALTGLARLRAANRFTAAAACEVLNEKHRWDSNPARRFLIDNYRYTGMPSDWVDTAELYTCYITWCREHEVVNPLAKTIFGREIGKAFQDAKSTTVRASASCSVRAWLGISPLSMG